MPHTGCRCWERRGGPPAGAGGHGRTVWGALEVEGDWLSVEPQVSLGRISAALQHSKEQSRSRGQRRDHQLAGPGAGGSGSVSLVRVCVADAGLPGTPRCCSRATEIWVEGTGGRGGEKRLGPRREEHPAATSRPPRRHHWATCPASTWPVHRFKPSDPTERQGLCVRVFSLGCHQDMGGRGAGRSACWVLPGVSLGLEGRAGLWVMLLHVPVVQAPAHL